MEKVEYIHLKVSKRKAPLLLMLLEEDFKKTQRAISSNIALRDFKINKAIEDHYDMESFLIHDIEKELKKLNEKESSPNDKK